MDRNRFEAQVADIIRQNGGRGLDPDVAAAEIVEHIERTGFALLPRMTTPHPDNWPIVDITH